MAKKDSNDNGTRGAMPNGPMGGMEDSGRAEKPTRYRGNPNIDITTDPMMTKTYQRNTAGQSKSEENFRKILDGVVNESPTATQRK
jgi:hypothetical protein